MKYIVLIPARYESSRFPGKPLAKIGGIEMIVRVCQQVSKSGVECAVATDDDRIADVVNSAGFKAIMTSKDCKSGTERVAEAFRTLGSDADVVINVQGDEPFIRPEQIEAVVSLFEQYPDAEIATLAKKFDSENGIDALKDPNLVKVTFGRYADALCFSRNVIPFLRKVEEKDWPKHFQYHTHIGIYGYKADTLQRIVEMPETPCEKAESLEQLRWLENGIGIKVGLTEFSTIGIDTPADLDAAESFLRLRN